MRPATITQSDTDPSGYCPARGGLLYSRHSRPNSWSCEWSKIAMESLEATSSRCILKRFFSHAS